MMTDMPKSTKDQDDRIVALPVVLEAYHDHY